MDLDLTKVWLNTAGDYLKLVKQPRKDVILKQLVQPWKLSTLKEHEMCFQQWNIIQLWIGIVATIVMLLMNIIWYLAEDIPYAKPPMGTIIINAAVGLMLTVFFTYLAWFGVINKHGCCCFIVCCCLGKPNLLAVSILSLIFGVLAVISALQLLGSVKGALIVLVLIGAFFALIHGIALLYVSFEAFMIWRLCSPEVPPTGAEQAKDSKGAVQTQVVGAPQTTSDVVAEMEAGAVKIEA
jgi:hypothetical protein